MWFPVCCCRSPDIAIQHVLCAAAEMPLDPSCGGRDEALFGRSLQVYLLGRRLCCCSSLAAGYRRPIVTFGCVQGAFQGGDLCCMLCGWWPRTDFCAAGTSPSSAPIRKDIGLHKYNFKAGIECTRFLWVLDVLGEHASRAASSYPSLRYPCLQACVQRLREAALISQHPSLRGTDLVGAPRSWWVHTGAEA